MSILEEYWSGVLRRLQAEVDTFNRLIDHQATKGGENEVSLARVLERLVPRRFGVGSGLLIDRRGKYSKQMDIVVFDQTDEPALLAQTNQVLFPIENVRFCIEVKTRLDKDEIEDAEEKRASIHALTSLEPLPPLALVSYMSSQTLPTVGRHLRDGVRAGADGRVDLALVVDQALIAGQAALLPTLATQAAPPVDYVVGVTPLQVVEGGERQVGRHVAPNPADLSTQMLVGGHLYTVASTPYGDVLAESSRALLLFCEAMLAHLARGQQRTSVLSDYITPAGWDLLSLQE